MSQQPEKSGGRLKESAVTKLLGNYLKTKSGLYYPQFHLTTGRRIDFVSFKWENDYEIEICGYECKGTITAKAAAKTLREQVADYQKVIPKMYLVANSKDKEKIKTLCSLNGVGFLLVTHKEIPEDEKVEAPKERQILLDDSYFKPLRAIAAMFLSFRECFEDRLEEEKPREGTYWCSTPEPNDKVQYNCGYDEDSKTVYCSVNLEHSRKVMKKIDLQRLGEELLSLPDEYWVRIGVKHFPAPMRPIISPLIQMKTSSLTIDDLSYLRERSRKNVIWFQTGKDLWSYDEILPRRVHVSRIKQARAELSDVHQIMSRKKS